MMKWSTRKQKTTHGLPWYALVRTRISNSPTSSFTQVSDQFRASIRFQCLHPASKCELWSDLARLWLHGDDVGRNSSTFVYRGWMGVSITSIGIQRSARCASVFWRGDSLPSHRIGVMTENRAVYFFSNYYVRVVFKVVDDEVPPELSDLFIDDGACLKGVYVKPYERMGGSNASSRRNFVSPWSQPK